MQQAALVDPVIFTDFCKTSRDSSLNSFEPSYFKIFTFGCSDIKTLV